MTEKVDIYAAGVILLELTSDFKTQHERAQALINLRERKTLPDKFTSSFSHESELILWMTENDPSKRPSAEMILSSEFI